MNLRIAFWKTKTNNFLSHSGGLDQDTVDAFKTLKVGDRLTLWTNKKDNTNSPDLTLKVVIENKSTKKNENLELE